MSRRDWIKILVLILLPINAWLFQFYYQRWRWILMYQEGEQRTEEIQNMIYDFFRERFGRSIKEGYPLRFPIITHVFGKYPPIGQGFPVLFLYIDWCCEVEVWDLAVQEALQADPKLFVVLLYQDGKEKERLAKQMWEELTKQFKTDRLSVLVSPYWGKSWGTMRHGTLAVICDGQGIVRVIEPYPILKYSPFWHEEVADWRPKFQQAVKKVLNKFFRQPKGRTIAPSSGGVR